MPGAVFICTRGQRNAPCSVPGCGQRHQFLCDWKLCARHARQVAKETHPKNPNAQGVLPP